MFVISEKQIDVITELINIGAGRGADVLNSFLSAHITLTVPEVRFLSLSEMEEEFLSETDSSQQLSSVEMKFSGPIKGAVELVFLSENAVKIVELITGEHDISHDFDEIKSATFSEVGNVVINAVLGAISNELALKLSFTIPKYLEGTKEELFSLLKVEETTVVLIAKTEFSIEDTEIKGDIIIYFSLYSFDSFLNALDSYIDSLIHLSNTP